MSTFVFGDQSVEVDPQNEAAFESAGWARVEEPKKKSRKGAAVEEIEPEVDTVQAEPEVESPPDETIEQ